MIGRKTQKPRLRFLLLNTKEATIATPPKKPAKKATKKAAVKKPALKAVKTPPAKKPAKTATDNRAKAMHQMIVKALDQDKGDNIVSIDLAGKSSIADYMVIVTGTSTRHVIGMAQKLKERLSKEGHSARLEGTDSGDWVIVDAGDVIVHLFRAEVRTFYNLEKLWSADFSSTDYTLYKSV